MQLKVNSAEASSKSLENSQVIHTLESKQQKEAGMKAVIFSEWYIGNTTGHEQLYQGG